MTQRPLDFAFPGMSALSLRPPHTIAIDEWLIEAEAELDRRLAAYPRQVKERGLPADEADRKISIWKWIARDARLRCVAPDAWTSEHAELQAKLDAGGWTWADKVREIRAELAMRRNAIPKGIEQRRWTEAEGRERLERLDALHWHYWISLWPIDRGADWRGVSPADARAICLGLQAQRDEWVLAADAAGDRALAGYLDPTWRDLLAGDQQRVWRAGAIATLAHLRPDLPGPTLEQDQAA